MILTREQIASAQDLKHEDVSVPEWGGTVRVRVMTGLEREAFSASLMGANGKPDMKNYKLGLVATCMVGEDGKPLFGLDEVQFLGDKSAVALERVFSAAEKLNGVGGAAKAAVEAAEGN